MRLLIEKEADVNACSVCVKYALHLTLNKGHEQIVRLPIEKGADVKAHVRGVMKVGGPRCTWLRKTGTNKLFSW